MSDYVIFIDDEYVAEWDAESFSLSDIIGAEMPDETSDTCAERAIVVYVNPTYCDHSTGECSDGAPHDDFERVIVSHEAKQAHTATVTIDGDGVIRGIDP